MKIIFFSKKTAILTILIIFLLGIIFLFLILQYSYNPHIEVSSYSSNFLNKVSSLTNQQEKVAYLTFDDGPTIKSTPKILDILAEENIKATFFVIGKYVQHHPDIVKRAYDGGHYIANHGYDHKNQNLYSSNESFINENKHTDEEIGKAVGIENYSSHVFRFPNGFFSPNYKSNKKNCVKLLESMDYTYIDWNCLNRDSERKYSNQQLLNNLKKTSKNKGTLVVLMHDTCDVNSSYMVLKESINFLREQGYSFKNFYDLQ